MTNQTNESESLTENVGIFVRKLIGQNKKISLVQKRNIARQIENYIRLKINPDEVLVDSSRILKQKEMYGKLRVAVDKMETYTKITRYGLVGGDVVDRFNDFNEDKRNFEDLLHDLTDGVDRLLLVVNNKIKRLMTELELVGEVLGCRKWGHREQESHSLHGMIIKLQTDNAAKVTQLSDERDMLKIFVQEHQINLENLEEENKNMADDIESHVKEIEQLRHQTHRIEMLEGQISAVTNQLRESERRCEVLENQLSQMKPASKVKVDSQVKSKSYANITSLYCNRLTQSQSLSPRTKKLPDLKAQFLSHLK